jgi:hypothetical protein
MNDSFLFLHGLAIKKFGTAGAVASILGTNESDTRLALERAVEIGEAAFVRGNFVLIPKGVERLNKEYAVRFRQVREESALGEAYEPFEIVNAHLKKLMTQWQTIEIAGELLPNDHSDANYDEKIIRRLEELHDDFEKISLDFVIAVPRLSRYRERLGEALGKIDDGLREYVSGVNVESYHTVWFELHEDLLRMLERVRHE